MFLSINHLTNGLRTNKYLFIYFFLSAYVHVNFLFMYSMHDGVCVCE